jgi:DnaJ-class molecular chaperone
VAFVCVYYWIDVVFTVVEKPHPHFARDGNNLIFTAKAR